MKILSYPDNNPDPDVTSRTPGQKMENTLAGRVKADFPT